MKILSSLKTSFFSKFVANTNWTTIIHIVTLCHTVPYSSTVRNCVISNSFFKRTYPGLFLHFSHACLFHTWLADVRMWTTNFHPCLFRYVPNTDNVKNVKYFSELCSLLTSTAVTTASTTSTTSAKLSTTTTADTAPTMCKTDEFRCGTGEVLITLSTYLFTYLPR